MRIPALWLISSLLLVTSASAAYLESDYDSQPASRVAPPPPDPERVPAENPAIWLLRNVEIGRPWHYRNLTVYPLALRNPPRVPDIRTLDEAFDRRWITVREKDAAQVSGIEVRNDSDRHILLMAGEILAGGKQNRMIRSDVLLPPRSEFIDIPVYCGEKERWSHQGDAFRAAGSVADFGLRSEAAKGASQDAIWREIDAQSERAKVASPTRSYQQIYEDRDVSRRLDEYAGHFRRFPARQTVGAVAVSGDRISGCDIFSDHDIFSRLWPKLLRSYSVDVFYRNEAASRVDSRDVLRFLNRAMSTPYDERRTPGVGRLYEISGASTGATLIWDTHTVHVMLSGETLRAPPPPPPPPPPPWEPPYPRPPWHPMPPIQPLPYREDQIWLK